MTAVRMLVLTAALAAGASDTLAQDAGSGRFLSPDETRQCLCMQDEIDALRAQLKPVDALEAEYERVDELVAKARPHVDTSDEAEVDSFRRMFARREALRQQLQAERGPRYSHLNGVAARYNALCAHRRMFKVNVDAVRADAKACTP